MRHAPFGQYFAGGVRDWQHHLVDERDRRLRVLGTGANRIGKQLRDDVSAGRLPRKGVDHSDHPNRRVSRHDLNRASEHRRIEHRRTREVERILHGAVVRQDGSEFLAGVLG